MAEATFYVGDTVDGCPEVDDESCDLIITSPPYFKRDGYSDNLMSALGDVFARVLKPGGRAYVIFGQIKEKLDRPFDVQREIMIGGLNKLAPAQTIIWVKSIAVGGWTEQCPQDDCKTKWRTEIVSRGHFQPINSPHLLNYCWEYVLGFVKQPEKDAHPLDRKNPRVGVGYADKTNEKRWASAGKLHCPGDVWFLPYETTGKTSKKVHRHEFPLELAHRLIVVSGIPKGSTVFDPFVGGGTTCYAARAQGMNSIGYDISEGTVASLRRSFPLGISDQTN